jgi:hypothetical protein
MKVVSMMENLEWSEADLQRLADDKVGESGPPYSFASLSLPKNHLFQRRIWSVPACIDL